MENRNTSSKLRLTGRIERKTYNTDKLQQQFDDWHEKDKSEKLSLVKETEPDSSETVYNVTTDSLHEYFVDNLDPDNISSAANVSAVWVGLGNDAASGTSTADTDLNNRTYEETVTDHADNGKDLLASTFVDSTEGNGNTFNEIGLFTGDPANLANADVFLINHATFSDIVKDSTKTVTFDVTLTFSDV